MSKEQEIRKFLNAWTDRQTWLEKVQHRALLAVLDLDRWVGTIGDENIGVDEMVKALYTALFPEREDV